MFIKGKIMDKRSNIVNKLIYPFWVNSIMLYENGISTFEDIDKVCKFGFGHPKGPFQMMDEIGLDAVCQGLRSFYDSTGDKRFKVPDALRRMVKEGILGKKAGKGFYNYVQESPVCAKTETLQKELSFINVKRVGVIGFGTMGRGIVQVIAEHGFEVIVKEVKQDLITKGICFIEKMLDRGVEKGNITVKNKKNIIGKVRGTMKLEDLKESDIIIEAAFEKMDLKKDIFTEIDMIVKPEAILVTNTSCLSVSEIAAATKRPDRFCGLHFFNPVPLMKLVEVIRATKTSEEVFKKAFDFGIILGKEPVKCNDSPGFIANRLLCPYLFHAIEEYDKGLTTKEDIDNLIKLETGFPMGPLELIDLIGLDVCLDIGEAMFRKIADPDLNPPSLLREMVKKKYLGKKLCKGFYDYLPI